MPVTALLLNQQTHIKIEGKDARKFLQGQLSCDIDQINPTSSRLTAHCNPQGRMVSLGRVYQYQEHLHYAVPQSIAETSIAKLKHYALFSKVSFAESELSSIGIVGEDARAVLSQHFILPKQADECVEQGPILIIQARGLPERFEIIGPVEELTAILAMLGLEPLQDNALWQKLDIKAGQAFLSTEAIGKFLPHDIRLPELNGVSFSKGCYIGQEIIARMHYLGKLKKQLCLMQLNTTVEPKAGLKILDANQQTQAEVICQALISPGQYLALAVFNQAPQDSEYLLEQNQYQAKLCQSF